MLYFDEQSNSPLRKRRGFERLDDPLGQNSLEAGSFQNVCCLVDGGVHHLSNIDKKQVGNEKGVIGNISASPSAWFFVSTQVQVTATILAANLVHRPKLKGLTVGQSSTIEFRSVFVLPKRRSTVTDDVLGARTVLSKRGLGLHCGRRAPETVREGSRPPVVEESGYSGFLFACWKNIAVGRRVLLACHGRCHVDEPVLAVFTGERQHHPVPLPLQMSCINCNHLIEWYRSKKGSDSPQKA